MKNSADQGGCYPQRPKAEVDNSLRCFIIHSKYFPVLKGVLPFRALLFRSPNIHFNTTLSPGFLGERATAGLRRAALLTSLAQYLANSSLLW